MICVHLCDDFSGSTGNKNLKLEEGYPYDTCWRVIITSGDATKFVKGREAKFILAKTD